MNYEIKIAIIGNPNCGKSTLFNALTGSSQYVGNWPGVTVEKKEGKFNYKGNKIVVVDLPGMYSLIPYSQEELVADEYILHENFDLIVNIVDASSLERNLYLTMQLLELNKPMIIALNMMDALKVKGHIVDVKHLSDLLHVSIVPITARDGTNIDTLIETILQLHKNFKSNNYMNHPYKPSLIKSSNKYVLIEKIISQVVTKNRKPGYLSITEKFDKVVINKYLALPIFLSIMFIIFALTFGTIGEWLKHLMEWLLRDNFTPIVINWLSVVNCSSWAKDLITVGIISGVGGVLAFIPQISILFLCLSFLEDSGYMSRVAFIMDRPLKKLGLSGKAFIPLLMGFGCLVPAIMATRAMEHKRESRMIIMIIPFMSCSAKLPIYGLLVSTFFNEHQGLIVFSLYIIGVILGVISGLIFKSTIFSSNEANFLMEMPPYRLPTFKSISVNVWDKVEHFLKKAATIIFSMSIIIWFLQSFNFSLHMVNNSQLSIIGIISRKISPILTPLGFGSWQIVVALISGLIAKEAVVSSLNVLYGISLTGSSVALSNAFASPVAAYAFLVFVLLYMPCIAAFSIMRRELNSWKLILISSLWQMTIAYLCAFLIFHVGTYLIS